MKQSIQNCTACSLHEFRTQVVPGYGSKEAKIAFIAEAPGKDEDEQGIPLVGKAGQRFNLLLKQAGLEREEVWLDNLVHCRPPQNNLTKYPNARATCPPLWLEPTLKSLTNLRVVVSMGATAGSLWFPGDLRVRELDGLMRSTGEYVVIGTYHPSATLRAGGLYDENIVRVIELAKEIGESHGCYIPRPA